jgi:hypothetical protein
LNGLRRRSRRPVKKSGTRESRPGAHGGTALHTRLIFQEYAEREVSAHQMPHFPEKRTAPFSSRLVAAEDSVLPNRTAAKKH